MPKLVSKIFIQATNAEMKKLYKELDLLDSDLEKEYKSKYASPLKGYDMDWRWDLHQRCMSLLTGYQSIDTDKKGYSSWIENHARKTVMKILK
jgi:hypothetical protein